MIRHRARHRFLATALLVAGLAGCQTPPVARPATHWQSLARADLDAARQAIVAAHPGMLDTQNPGFRDWVDVGHQQALALLPRVDSYDAALAAVRFYATGFLDGHLLYSDNVRGDEPSRINGWVVERVNGVYIVAATTSPWPTPLPAKGDRLIECDGSEPDALLRTNVAPYTDRRDQEAVRESLALDMLTLWMPGAELKRCTFSRADGSRDAIDVHYQPVAWEPMFELISAARRPIRRANGFSMLDGVVWVHVASFQLQPEQARALETMLAGLRGASGGRAIVFDLRGNSGGDSSVGARIFEAATGGLDFDRSALERLPQTHAQWRVSELAVSTAQSHVQRAGELYGESSPQAQRARALMEQLGAARAAGQPWVDQPGGPLLTRADMQQRGGRLRRFAGPVALLTDHRCASACLDFADAVRRVPGAVHLGRTTSADAVYIDMGIAPLPSGNHLAMPLKVWRNRGRGNNEPLVPDLPLAVDLDDDEAVRAGVLAALRPTGRPRQEASSGTSAASGTASTFSASR